ncbi:MAG: hypothetical protein O7A04_00235 [Acidobacteria bacterium]|nr:hypothetical protein [Acidobacteriota bacterium]
MFSPMLFPARDRDASLAISWLSVIPLWAVALALITLYGAARLSETPLAEDTVVGVP